VEEFATQAEELASAQKKAMDDISKEHYIQLKNIEEYFKNQDEVNARTAKQLELEREIANVVKSYEKEYGDGSSRFIPADKLNDWAQSKFDADRRRAGKSKRGGGRRERDNDFGRITKQIGERTAALNASTAIQSTLNPLVNDYGFALARAMTAHQMLNAAEKAGVADKQGVKQTIEQLAQAYAQAEMQAQKLSEAQDRLRAKLEEVQATAKDVMRGFIDDLIAGKSATEALGNALTKIGNNPPARDLKHLGLHSPPFAA